MGISSRPPREFSLTSAGTKSPGQVCIPYGYSCDDCLEPAPQDVTNAFMLIGQNQRIGPDQSVSIGFFQQGDQWNIFVAPNDPLADQSINVDEADADGGVQDPVNFVHGTDSYYFGDLYYQTGHLIDSTDDQTLSAHTDMFGPLELADHLADMIMNSTSPKGYTWNGICSMSAGCFYSIP